MDLWRYDEPAMACLHESLHPNIRLSLGPELPDPADYHHLITGRPKREALVASPNLRALIIPWAGLPESTRELMLAFPGIAVHNLHHNALPVAEHVIALLLAAAKFIVPMDRSLRRGDWTPRYGPNPSLLLAGKTVLILGYGAIGQQVGSLCRGLGMEVIGIRRRAGAALKELDNRTRLAGLDSLDSLLPQAQVLIVCLPHTPETEHLIGAEELSLLPPQAVLVNVARGPIVDEAPLYHALRDRTLYAAGLDVWYTYPAGEAARSYTLPSNYPFHELENVVMSPHRAGGSTETEKLRMEHLALMLNAAARGESMPNQVDLRAGY
jgi:phosphoglycerate dehydrogenase-like enzyme